MLCQAPGPKCLNVPVYRTLELLVQLVNSRKTGTLPAFTTLTPGSRTVSAT